jgi:hypothetical protein
MKKIIGCSFECRSHLFNRVEIFYLNFILIREQLKKKICVSCQQSEPFLRLTRTPKLRKKLACHKKIKELHCHGKLWNNLATISFVVEDANSNSKFLLSQG